MTALAGLPTVWADLAPRAAGAGLHGLRLLPPALLSPFLGGPMVPPLIHLALAFGLGTCAWSSAGAPAAELDGWALLAGGARELALGAALGVVAALPFEAARAGGRLVDTLRGATLAELHVAPLRRQESATGDLLVQWAVVLGATAGGDRLVVAALLDTFRAVPAGAPLAAGPLAGVGVRAMGELASCALALGAPAAAGVFAADLALALATRALPPLHLASAAQPARAALGVLLVALPAAAVGGRLAELVALSSQLVRATAAGAAP